MRNLILSCLILLFLSPATIEAQQLESKDNKKRLAEINSTLETVERQLKELKSKQKELETERAVLLEVIAYELNEEAFKNSPAYPVVRVSGERKVVLIVNGREQEVALAGVHVKWGQTDAAIDFLRKELRPGLAYVRCLDIACSNVQMYSNKEQASLNCQMLSSGIGMYLPDSGLDCGDNQTSPAGINSVKSVSDSATSTVPPYSPSTSTKSTPGTEVHVDGYYRKDGTYVRPHTRSKPRKKN